MEKKEIEISSSKIKIVLKSFLYSIIVIYLFNHTGKFYNRYNNLESDNTRALKSYGYITPETTVTVEYTSPFGTKVVCPQIFKPEDTWTAWQGTDSYLVKAECYITAIFKDIIYVLILTILISSVLIFFSKNKISIK